MTLLALIVVFAVGFPAARRADGDAPLLRCLGESFLLGIGICAMTLFALSIIGVRWTLLRALIAVLIVMIAVTRRAPLRLRVERLQVIDLLTLATIVGYALFATVAPPAEIDFIADWGLKARTFAAHGGINWSFLQNAWYRWDHPDYPPLLPLTFDWITLFSGDWSPQSLGMLYPAIGLALLAIIRSLFADEFASPFLASLATLAIAPLALSPWIGIAEAPIVAFGTAAVLLGRRGLMIPAALMLGFATMTKNEGLAMLVAFAIALALTQPRLVPKLWPAVAIALPWLAARAIFGLSTGLIGGPILTRALERMRTPQILASAFIKYATGAPLLWIGVVIALAVSFRMLREEAFALLWIGIEFAFYIAAYLVTESDVAWQVRWSWERLVSHLTPTLAFIAIVLLWRLATRGTMTTNA